MFIVPAAPMEPHREQTTTLDGRQYVMRFDWIQRIERWAFSLFTSGGSVALVRSKGLVLGSDLLRQSHHDPRVPQGVLLVVDLEDRGTDPTLATLGRRHVILYFPADS